MEKSEVEKKKQSIDRNNRYAKRALWIGIPCVLVMPFVFTHCFPSAYKDTGVIGDTIGGTTAPIVGLIGAILVYLSFKQQLIANEIQIELIKTTQKNEQETREREIAAIEKELLKIHYDEIKANIQSLSYTTRATQRAGEIPKMQFETYSGKKAVEMYCNKLIAADKRAIKEDFYLAFATVMKDILSFLYSVKENKILKENERDFFRHRMTYLYAHNILLFLAKADNIEKLDEDTEPDFRLSRIADLITDNIRVGDSATEKKDSK